MDIEGVGESIVELLVDNNIVHSPIDIYKIIDPSLRMTLKSFPTIGDKKIDSII
jgi:NAD-dependent DNA ligase